MKLVLSSRIFVGSFFGKFNLRMFLGLPWIVKRWVCSRVVFESWWTWKDWSKLFLVGSIFVFILTTIEAIFSFNYLNAFGTLCRHFVVLLAESRLVNARVTITFFIVDGSALLRYFFRFFFAALDWLLFFSYWGTIFPAVFTCDFYFNFAFLNWRVFLRAGIALFNLSVKQSILPFTLQNSLFALLNSSPSLPLKLALLLFNVLIFIGNLINNFFKHLFFNKF